MSVMAAIHHLQPGQYRQHQSEGEQLAMFMRPSDIQRDYYPADSGTQYLGTMRNEVTPLHPRSDLDNQVWDWKADEARSPSYNYRNNGEDGSIKEAVARGQVSNPVTLSRTTREYWLGSNIAPKGEVDVVTNGHHRIAAGVELEREGHEVYLPVLHSDTRRP